MPRLSRVLHVCGGRRRAGGSACSPRQRLRQTNDQKLRGRRRHWPRSRHRPWSAGAKASVIAWLMNPPVRCDCGKNVHDTPEPALAFSLRIVCSAGVLPCGVFLPAGGSLARQWVASFIRSATSRAESSGLAGMPMAFLRAALRQRFQNARKIVVRTCPTMLVDHALRRFMFNGHQTYVFVSFWAAGCQPMLFLGFNRRPSRPTSSRHRIGEELGRPQFFFCRAAPRSESSLYVRRGSARFCLERIRRSRCGAWTL